MAKRPSRPALAARVLSRSSYPEYLRISEILRLETVGGALLLAGHGRGPHLGQLAGG